MKKITFLTTLFFLGVASLGYSQSNLSDLLDKYEGLEDTALPENIVLENNFTASEILTLNNYFANLAYAPNNSSSQSSVPNTFTVLDVRNNEIFGTLPGAPPYTAINVIVSPLAATSFCGDYADDGQLYGYNIIRDANNVYIGLEFVTINDTNGNVTVIGDVFSDYPSFPAGLSYDFTTSTMYGIANGSLYTVDLSSGIPTLVGDMNTGGIPIWLVIDNQGNAYSANITDDLFYTVDLSDATSTAVGSLGIDISFAQDATIDPADNTVYMGAYIGGGAGGIYTVDVSTGLATLVGDTQPLNAEFGILAVSGQPNLSVESNVLSQTAIYPNPSSDIVNVKVPASLEIISSALYDLLGKNTGIQINNNMLDISALPKGTYLLNIETTAGTFSEKIIKR